MLIFLLIMSVRGLLLDTVQIFVLLKANLTSAELCNRLVVQKMVFLMIGKPDNGNEPGFSVSKLKPFPDFAENNLTQC